MSNVYDSWERLVAAAIKKDQLWKLFHQQSRTPSICSEPSEASSSFNSLQEDVPFDFSTLGDKEGSEDERIRPITTRTFTFREIFSFDADKEGSEDERIRPITTRTFTFRELSRATNNFRESGILREGGFGKVFEGRLESTNQVVAIKQLDKDNLLLNRQFLVETLMLSLVHHSNVVNLIGYCADGDQRLLVYEHMRLGSLENQLHNLPSVKEPLDWNKRMQIAAGVAKGLEYLHNKVNPPIIHRNLKCSNVLLNEGYHAKLSDFGIAKMGPIGNRAHVSTRVMGTLGYCAPEYAMTGQLTTKADVYSFGVVLFEIITGRKAFDFLRPNGEQNLISWVGPLLKDRSKFPQMADPVLQGEYPVRGLYEAIAVASVCVQEQPELRPPMADVVTATTYLASQNFYKER